MVSPKRLPRTLSACKIKPSSQDKRPIGNDLELSYFYENGLPFAVKVIFRSGFSVILPPNGLPGINNQLSDRVYDFVVRSRLRYAGHLKIDADGVLDGIQTEQQSKELYALALAANQPVQMYTANWHAFALDFHVTKDVYMENIKTGIYVPEVDLLITSPDVHDVVHPFSADGTAIRANESKDLLGYFYRIEIIDPYDHFGSRFINIAGNIDRVIPVTDHKRKPGVYVHRVMCSDPAKPADINPSYFEFSDAAVKLKLFRTEDEARAMGDLGEEQKREFEKATHEMKMALLKAEKELKDETARHKASLMEYEARKREIEELKELISTLREERLSKLKEDREVRSAHRDDFYEARSHSRKDDSEWLKWVPAVILGGGLLAYKIFWD